MQYQERFYILPREMQYRGFLSLKEICVTNECEVCTEGSKLHLYMLKDGLNKPVHTRGDSEGGKVCCQNWPSQGC